MSELDHQLTQKLKEDISRAQKSAKEKPTLLAETIYLGTIGVMMALPVVAGAYLGEWLDHSLKGFSVSWTISLIFLGVLMGSFNVYWFLKEHE